MRRAACLGVLLIAACSAAAQPSARLPKPYEPVAITRPKAFEDESFVTFRTALGAAAKARVYAGLTALVRKRDFFWDRDFAHQFDPRKPPVDNLSIAIALEHDNGAGWARLAEFAEEAAAEPLDSRPGVICAPMRPAYDSIAYAKLLQTSYTEAIDWAYPRADATAVRAKPEPGAATIGTLGAAFVWLLGFEGPDSEPDPGRKLWARVVMPNGETGFVGPDSLRPLTAERLCYTKDPVEGWQIAGFVAGGN
jgi:hypothetical protein